MATKTRIQLRRGNQDDLPTLLPGEPGFALDTEKLYIGTGNHNVLVNPTPAELGGLCQGRLTFLSGVAVPDTDISNATDLYFTPYHGNMISLYDGSQWKNIAFSEVSFNLRGTTYYYGYPYDVFIYKNGGNLVLTIVQWLNDTTRSTSLSYQDGVLVRSDNHTHRYLGTLYGGYRAGYAGIWGFDTATQRGLYNHYNQVMRYGFVCPNYNNNNAATTYSVSAGTTMATISPTIEFLIGAPSGANIFATLAYRITAGSGAAHVGIGLDNTTDVRCCTTVPASTQESGCISLPIYAASGYHNLRFKAGAVSAAATITADDGRYGAAADVPVSYLSLMLAC